jgi:hypothetical protein
MIVQLSIKKDLLKKSSEPKFPDFRVICMPSCGLRGDEA